MLTEARNYKRNDPNAHIPIYEHIKLLILYVLSRIDIHGGYFDGAVTQRLIYRLACLGFAGTAAAYGNTEFSVERVRAASDSDHAVGATGRERSARSGENGYFSARARVL